MAKNDKEEKTLFWEIGGILLLGIGIYVLISLLSYTPSDPSINAVNTSDKIHNWGGRIGAYLSDLLITAFGLTSFLIPFLLLVLSVEMMAKRGFTFGLLRSVTFLFLLSGISGLLSLFMEGKVFLGGRVPGGGFVGETLATFLTGYLNAPGATVVLLLLALSSAIVTTGMSIVELTRRLVRSLSRLSRRVWKGTLGRQREGPKVRGKGLKKTPEINVREKKKEEPLEEPLILPEPKGDFSLPPISLLDSIRDRKDINRDDLLRNARVLERKLLDFGIEGRVTEVRPGPVITLYEFEPAPGIKINRITNLSDDLALALKALSIRIIAPIPGKAAVGIEVPNRQRERVSLREILEGKGFVEHPSPLTLALGKDIEGRAFITDLLKMPHLLIAGSTGAGKSVSLNAMIVSILYKATPDRVRFVMIDPKRLELSTYNSLPHLLLPVVTEAKKATPILKGLLHEMEERYRKMAEAGVRNIDQYNKQAVKKGEEPLPYIVVVIDEMADLMMTAQREFEDAVVRLAQMARASGIHLIIATQRPSVDVITGLIKANFPARIAFQVPSRTDSRTILDTSGAEKLLGEGDMLFLPPGTSKVQRVHGAFVSDGEIKRVVEFLARQGRPEYREEILRYEEMKEKEAEEGWDDELYDEAVRLVTKTGQASISFIQRRLRIGYNRAARMVERMEREGIVGPAEGSRPREVLKK